MMEVAKEKPKVKKRSKKALLPNTLSSASSFCNEASACSEPLAPGNSKNCTDSHNDAISINKNKETCDRKCKENEKPSIECNTSDSDFNQEENNVLNADKSETIHIKSKQDSSQHEYDETLMTTKCVLLTNTLSSASSSCNEASQNSSNACDTISFNENMKTPGTICMETGNIPDTQCNASDNDFNFEENNVLHADASKMIDIESNQNLSQHECDETSMTVKLTKSTSAMHVLPSLAIQSKGIASTLLKKKIYPNLETIEHCKDMDGILSSQTMVKTYSEKFLNMTFKEVMQGHKEFLQELPGYREYPLFDMTYKFQTARKFSSMLRKKLKSLDSKLRRKKKMLWNSVGRSVFAQGKCQDGTSLNVLHEYTVKELDQDTFNEVKEMLSEIEKTHISDFAFHTYVEHQMHLKIDQFIYDLIRNDMLPDSSIDAVMNPNSSSVHNSLKKSISVLFSFQRESTNDKEFLLISRQWLTRLVPILLHNGSLSDNLFIVNHVLRCPNGVHSWAAEFIQIPMPDVEKQFECRYLHYILVVLYMILNPNPDREEFLRNIKCVKVPCESHENFTLLDSDGEEEDSFDVIRDWSENDVLSLLNQIPFTKLFEQVLLISPDKVYDIKKTSENGMLKLFAFSTALINIYICGLENFRDGLFIQLIEVICNQIRHTVCYVSDHWKNYIEENLSFSPGLQAEFDRFIFHVVYKLFSFQRLRVWKFLTSLPYSLVSSKMLWSLIWIFHSPGVEEEIVYSEKDVDTKLQDESNQFIFLEKLSGRSVMVDIMVDEHDALYLLNAYEKMAIGRNKDRDFICFITQEIFEVTFVHEVLRNTLYKEGEILISSIAQNNTFLISFLIVEIDRRDEEIASWAQKLFSKINFTMWIPESETVQIISTWLLSKTLSSPKNGLARLILKKLNWNYDKEGKLHLPLDLHRKVAILVLSAYMKFDADGNKWPVSKGLQQMLQLYSPISSFKKDEDNGFTSWAWNLIFSLKLHILDASFPPWLQVYDGFVYTNDMLDVHQDTSLHPLAQAFDEKHPMGLYLILVMTKIGHSVNLLADEGLTCVSTLVDSQQYAAAIKLLFYTLPFFVKNVERLLSHEKFIICLREIVVADKTWLNYSSGVVVGAILHYLVSMIKHQIEETCKISIEYAQPMLKLWLQVLFHILTFGDKDYKSKFKNKLKSTSMQLYFLLDVLVKIAFINPHTRDGLLDQMNAISRPLTVSAVQSSWSVMFNDSGAPLSLINKRALPEYPWLAFYILLSETKQKISADLWNCVQKDMIKEELMLPEVALKKICNLSKVNCPPVEFLPIYRWAFQIVETPVIHPALVLLCQQFFILYFQRVQTATDQEMCSKSIGERFFKTKSTSEILKKIRKKIKEAEVHYINFRDQSKQIDTQNYSVDAPETKYKEQLQIFNSLILTFKAFSMWMDDTELHLSSLCLSALDPKYDIEKLRLIIENDQRPWFELILIENIKEELNQKIHPWYQKRMMVIDEKIAPHDIAVVGSEHILRHLSSYEAVKPLSISEQLNPPVKQINDNVLTSWNGMIAMVEEDQAIIYKNAKTYMQFLNKLKELNMNYTNWIPQEYMIENTEIVQRKVCHKGSEGVNCCSGAAVFKLKVQKCEANELIQTKSQANRIEFHSVMEQIINLPLEEICEASVHMEICVSELVKKIRATKGDDATELINIGVSLFYRQMEVIDKINSSVANYSPSQQFFASSVDLLGKEFIEGQDDECLALVKAILKYPSAGRLASHLFKPNVASSVVFLDVYETLALSIGKCDPSAILVLLSKIDLQNWLIDERVSFPNRKLFFKKVSQALCQCGNNPEESLFPVYEIFKKHFCLALLYLFPEHYSDAVQLLLNGIKTNKLCIDIWYETFRCFGCYPLCEKSSCEEVKYMVRKFANNQLLPPEEQLFVSNQTLNLTQISETLEIFSKFAMDIRLSSDGLYEKCKMYVKSIGIFLAMLGHSLIGLFLTSNTTQVYSVQHSWSYIEEAFHPWIYPVETEVCLKFPWLPDQEKSALFMHQMFGICLEYFHEKLIGVNCERSILSCVWKYYVETYVRHGHRNYSVIVCHTAFANLPWHDFHPCTDDIEGMCKVLQSGITESRNFLTDISMRIPWLDVMNNISKTKSPEYIGKTLATLGKLLIISGWEVKFSVVQMNSHQNNLKAVEGLSWHFLTLADVEELLELYYDSVSDPVNLLKQSESCPDIYVHQFLKHVCCMRPQNSNSHLHSNQKRLLFLRKFLHCCISRKKELKEINNILVVVPSLFSDIDLVILKDVSPDQQVASALPLVREVVVFINDISDIKLRNQAVEHSIGWLNQHLKSPLLLPCLKAACDCLTSMENLVSIVECCISTRFDTESQDPCEVHYIWQLISSYFQVSLAVSKEFLNVCAEQNAHLSFYIYVLHQIPKASSAESKKKLLQDMLDYTKKTELKENSESKMILLWDKILKLCLLLPDENELQVVCNALHTFCSTLSLLGEDRTRKGILAAIGFGGQSSLSVNFRFLCRAMAAFLHAQMPENGPLRLEMMASGYMSDSFNAASKKSSSKCPIPSTEALKALDALKDLCNNKSYAALRSQIDSVIKSVMNPTLCLLESRKLLKDLALYLFPNRQYLHTLGK